MRLDVLTDGFKIGREELRVCSSDTRSQEGWVSVDDQNRQDKAGAKVEVTTEVLTNDVLTTYLVSHRAATVDPIGWK